MFIVKHSIYKIELVFCVCAFGWLNSIYKVVYGIQKQTFFLQFQPNFQPKTTLSLVNC